jgi:hypothetical protein
LDEHASGRGDHNYRLWLLLNLELWFRLFMDDASIKELERFVGSFFSKPLSALTGTHK